MRLLIPVVLATTLAAALPATGQSLAQRVAQVSPDRTVIFEYAPRPGVCGDGTSIMILDEDDMEVVMRNGAQMLMSRSGRQRTRSGECRIGPVRIELEGGPAPTVLRASVGATDSPAGAVNLGTVPAAEASAFLIDAAAATRSGRAGSAAIFAATLAEGVEPWRELLALARDARALSDVRKSAVFWVGQAVEERATAGLTDLVDDDDADMEARETAVFALSQRPNDQAVPALLEIAQSSPHPKLRRSAIFWLGQSDDPRALAWFEEVLLRGSR